MTQLLLPNFPDGSIQISDVASILKKDGRVTYFVGGDNFLWHDIKDNASMRLALAMLMEAGHARPCEISRSALGIPHRTLMNWRDSFAKRGMGAFHMPRRTRKGTVMTGEKISECATLLGNGLGISEAARQAGVGVSTLSKAVGSGRVVPSAAHARPSAPVASDKSSRSLADSLAANGIGTACTRADERFFAALGMIGQARTRFEHCADVLLGGVLAGLPALQANGLFSGIGKFHSLPRGYYSACHILMLLGFMALARIRRPEGLRHIAPGELGKSLGLDRVPEVRTLRQKIGVMAADGKSLEWMRALSRQWMCDDPDEAGYLYVDGHVRVYHGSEAKLPRRYVSREKLCLSGTTDYWVNDALGRPFFVVSKALNEGLGAAILDEILPELLESVPRQPTEEELAADPLLHRFVVVFDREGANATLLAKLWEQRVAAITYRKNVKDVWSADEFGQVEVPAPDGGISRMMLASRKTTLGKTNPVPVIEVRRLTDTGHQTAIISTALKLEDPVIAGRMFSRWCQENFFAYMMQHYDIDGLIQYGAEDIPGTSMVVNPLWRTLDKSVRKLRRQIERINARIGVLSARSDGKSIRKRAELFEDVQLLTHDMEEKKRERKATPQKVTLESLPEKERPRQLLHQGKMLSDTIKMIAYRAETALVGLLQPHLAKESEARALVRELLVSSADLIPDEQQNTLTVRIHRMTTPARDKAIEKLLGDLNTECFRHPETGMRMIYELV